MHGVRREINSVSTPCPTLGPTPCAEAGEALAEPWVVGGRAWRRPVPAGQCMTGTGLMPADALARPCHGPGPDGLTPPDTPVLSLRL